MRSQAALRRVLWRRKYSGRLKIDLGLEGLRRGANCPIQGLRRPKRMTDIDGSRRHGVSLGRSPDHEFREFRQGRIARFGVEIAQIVQNGGFA